MSLRRLTPVLAATALLVCGPVHASSVRAATIEDLARSADAVIRGRVEALRVVTVDHGRRIFTIATVTVLEDLSGTKAKKVEVVLEGGVDGKIEQRVVGMPQLTRGEEVVLFLSRPGGPKRAVPRFRLEALSLAVFRVDGGQAVRVTRGLSVVTGPIGTSARTVAAENRLPLPVLERRIRAALHAPGRRP